MEITVHKICQVCAVEYDVTTRLGKPGKITICGDCADEIGDVTQYTGNMIYSHKTGCSIQINTDPRLTQYLNDTTKLKNKGSNMGDNIVKCGTMKNRTEGACKVTSDAFNYKNRDGV